MKARIRPVVCFFFGLCVPWLVAAAESVTEIPLLTGSGGDRSSLYVHLPDPAKRTGTALIICPGGGYDLVSLGNEGHDVAKWFNARGVACFVLKYRLPKEAGNGPQAPLDDAHAAILEVRGRATEWGIDPHRIGFIGFSAGGHVAVTAGTHYDTQTRPDFMMLIYPVITMGKYTHAGSQKSLLGLSPDPELVKFYSAELQVTKDTPPAFITHAGDDNTVHVMNSIDFYVALQRAGVPAEMHIYEVGEHGMRGRAGYGIGDDSLALSGTWPARAVDWMTARGLLGPKPANYKN